MYEIARAKRETFTARGGPRGVAKGAGGGGASSGGPVLGFSREAAAMRSLPSCRVCWLGPSRTILPLPRHSPPPVRGPQTEEGGG